MLDKKKIAFIGSGAMAEAMISGLLRHKLARLENLHSSDTLIERLEEVHKKTVLNLTPIISQIRIAGARI